MTLTALRDDALVSDPGRLRAAARPALDPLAAADLAARPVVTIDGVRCRGLTVALDGRRVPPAELTEDDGWWFQQDRVTLARAAAMLAPGSPRCRGRVPPASSRTCRPDRTAR